MQVVCVGQQRLAVYVQKVVRVKPALDCALCPDVHKHGRFYCPVCGGPLVYKFAYGMDRLCCTKCGRINYENPVVGVAAIILNEQGKILLVKRAPDTTVPNKWCIP